MHNSRADVQTLAKSINSLQSMVHKLIDNNKIESMNDIFKQLGEIVKPQKQGGFFDLPNVQTCKSNEHNPPSHIYIPQGKGFKHICPACGKETTLIPPQISF